MLRIRPEQMSVFDEHMRRSFEARLVAHVAKRFRPECALAGEDATRARVRAGIERAVACGVTIEADVARYIELMYQFGDGFDQSPWAAPILQDPHTSSRPKTDALCARAQAVEPASS